MMYEILFLTFTAMLAIVSVVLSGVLIAVIWHNIGRPETEYAKEKKDTVGEINMLEIRKNWKVLSASVAGKSHRNGLCQDSHGIEDLGEGWMAAVVADGLGSKRHSDIGSKEAVKKGLEAMKRVVQTKGWIEKEMLPSEQEWSLIGRSILFEVFVHLYLVSLKRDIAKDELATTFIGVIASPLGVMLVHMGDGRAGYCGIDGEWEAMMKPINGEASNIVVPVTHDIWTDTELVDTYTECRVVAHPVKAFVMMSDGCEDFSYSTLTRVEGQNQIVDLNEPYGGFFEPIICYAVHQDANNDDFQAFLTDGTERIESEPDDKTMIIAYNPHMWQGVCNEESSSKNGEQSNSETE